jgi:hypothetical protein
LAYRQGHISPARTHYCLTLNRKQLFGQDLRPPTAAALRTLVEQSRLTIGLPEVPELPWLKPTSPPKKAIRVTEPNRDFIPPGQSFVKSDTGELTRNWKFGIQTINAAKTQAAQGWIGGKTLQLNDVTFQIETPKATVVLSSVDGQPLASSRYILITALARAVASTSGRLPFLSEPVSGTITLRTTMNTLELLSLSSSGKIAARQAARQQPDGVTIQLPTRGGTHWYVLAAKDAAPSSASPATTRAGE